MELSRDTNLDAIGVGIEFVSQQKFLPEIDKLKDDLNSEREIGQDLIQRLVKKTRESDKLIESWNEEHGKFKEEIRKSLKKDETITKLESELRLANEPLPKRPRSYC